MISFPEDPYNPHEHDNSGCLIGIVVLGCILFWVCVAAVLYHFLLAD